MIDDGKLSVLLHEFSRINIIKNTHIQMSEQSVATVVVVHSIFGPFQYYLFFAFGAQRILPRPQLVWS